MALFKNFAIHESISLQFRAEAFNVFNHTQWARTLNASTTGSGAVANNTATCQEGPTTQLVTRHASEMVSCNLTRRTILEFSSLVSSCCSSGGNFGIAVRGVLVLGSEDALVSTDTTAWRLELRERLYPSGS